MKNGLLDPALLSFVFAPLVVTVALLSAFWWKRMRDSHGEWDMPGLLLASAVGGMPHERRDWGAAMLAELAQLQHPVTRWQFALGCARVALFPPHPGGPMNIKNITANPRTAALIGLLSIMPFMLLNTIVANRIEPFFSLIRPGIHTSRLEYVLLPIVLLLLPVRYSASPELRLARDAGLVKQRRGRRSLPLAVLIRHPPSAHSCLSATSGSTFIARRAGM